MARVGLTPAPGGGAGGGYSKPAGGIPATDLAATVRASLGRGDSSVQYLKASGDTTGATDVAAINAALSVGANVILQPGATFYVNAPIYLRSRTTLDATTATINMVGTGYNMLRNAAMDPTRTVTDASATSNGAGGGDTTVVSPSAAFTSADIGAKVGVVGGGYGGSVWYGTITAVTSATQAVLSARVQATVSGARLDIFANRDTDITVRGGYWNASAPTGTSHDATSTAFNHHSTCLRRIDRSTFRDMVWTQQGLTGQGGKFALSFGDVTELTVNNIHFTRTAGDGVHVNGPARSVSVTDIYGTTGDDMVVCNSTDSYGPTIIDTQGDVIGFTTERIFPLGSLSAFKAYNTDLYQVFRMDTITCRTVKGTTVNGVRIDGDSFGATYGVVVEDIAVTTGSNTIPAVSINSTRVNDIKIADVVWLSNSMPTNGIVSGSARNLRVENLSMIYGPTSGGTGIGLRLVNSTGYQSVILDGIKMSSTPTPFHAVSVQGGTHRLLVVKNIALSSAAGRLVNGTTGTTIEQLNIEDCHVTTPNLVQLASAANAAAIRVLNTVFAGTSLVSTGQPATVSLTNVDVTTTAAVIAAVGTSATPVRARVLASAQTGAGALLSRDGTQELSANGATVGVDQAILTPRDGDEVYNTNASAANGVGRAIYNTAAAKWKNLYSGLTS